MKASELKTLLELLAPCLGDEKILPILGKVCFDEGRVYAFNDVVATEFNWDHGFGKFAVDGKALSAVLAQIPDETPLSLLAAKTSLQVKAGKAIIELPILGPEAFIFSNPEVKRSVKATIAEVADPVRLPATLFSLPKIG